MTGRIAPLVLGYAAGVAAAILVPSAIFTFVLGDISTDAGSPAMTFAFALVASAVLAGAGGLGLAGVLAVSRPLLVEWPRRWSVYGGAVLGVLVAIAAGVGVLSRLARALAPFGGRASWVLAAALAGAACALIVIVASRVRDRWGLTPT